MKSQTYILTGVFGAVALSAVAVSLYLSSTPEPREHNLSDIIIQSNEQALSDYKDLEEKMSAFENELLEIIRSSTAQISECGHSPLHYMCPSVADYLKSKISESPLSENDAKQLPSFQGEEYSAPPFSFQI